MHNNEMICIVAYVLWLWMPGVASFVPTSPPSHRQPYLFDTHHPAKDRTSSPNASSYEDTDGASKGIVSSLTNLVNLLSKMNQKIIVTTTNTIDATTTPKSSTTAEQANLTSRPTTPPTSPQELLLRLQQDYQDYNYLWTGDLDVLCFRSDCRFTDPTLSFVGTDTFRKNTQNLVPLVEAFVEDSASTLLSIELVEGPEPGSAPNRRYIETRWNMVGSLTVSPLFFWKPKINVIGRTKFWFDKRRKEGSEDDDDNDDTSYSYQVYFYDEQWEIPAYQALLQLITPAGTWPNSQSNESR